MVETFNVRPIRPQGFALNGHLTGSKWFSMTARIYVFSIWKRETFPALSKRLVFSQSGALNPYPIALGSLLLDCCIIAFYLCHMLPFGFTRTDRRIRDTCFCYWLLPNTA